MFFARIKYPLGTALLVVLIVLAFAGCATRPLSGDRPFAFGQDTFTFENELVWEYYQNEAGQWTARKREPKPDYTLHCFPVARSAKAFFLNARFDASRPRTNESQYKLLVRRVLDAGPRRALPNCDRVVIPGYANLNDFSRDYEALLKAECGTAVSSYFQRGHWRMVLPFSSRRREKTADQLCNSISNNCPAVTHIFTFPSLKVNHAIVVFDAERSDDKITFRFYDPNYADKPGQLVFDKQSRRFLLNASTYFPGGEVQAYQVFHRWNY